MELHLSLNEIRQKFNLPEDVKIVISDDFPTKKQEELVTPDDLRNIMQDFNDLKPNHKQYIASNIFFAQKDVSTFIQLMSKRKIPLIESFCKSIGKPPHLVWNTIMEHIEAINSEELPEIFKNWCDLGSPTLIKKLYTAYTHIERQAALNIINEIDVIIHSTESWKIKTPQINSVFHARNLKSEPFWNMLKSL